jgi:hypothetical protein
MLGSQSFLLDLAILSSCDHSVIDYGTFGVWVRYNISYYYEYNHYVSGSFRSRGEVILPQSATIKYKHFHKLLNWTVLEGY